MPLLAQTSRYPIVAIVIAIVIGLPETATACDWGYSPLSSLFDESTDVFVGTVSPFTPRAKGAPPLISTGPRFLVSTRYKGPPDREVFGASSGGCGYPFVEGVTYLVFGISRKGQIETGYPMRPLRVDPPGDALTQRQVSEALKYVEARAAGRPVALFFGSLHLPAAPTAADRLVIHAEEVGRRATVTVEVPNTAWNLYELVTAPGDYRIHIRLNGKRTGPVMRVRIRAGETRDLRLGPSWPGHEGRTEIDLR